MRVPARAVVCLVGWQRSLGYPYGTVDGEPGKLPAVGQSVTGGKVILTGQIRSHPARKKQ